MSDEETETKPRVRKKKTATKRPPTKKVVEAPEETVEAAPAEAKDNGAKPGFIAFEEPPEAPSPNGATWKTRLPVLRDHYEGVWTKYGPFNGTMVKSSETTCHKNASNLGISIETETRVEGDEGYLFVRVV